MALMLVGVILSGVVASKLLLLLGLGSMRTRYGLAVLTAYVVFFALIALWLAYVRRIMFGVRAAGAGGSSGGGVNFDLGSLSGGRSGSGLDLPRFSSGGGSFGGGGASGSFADAGSQSNITASSAGGSGGSSSGGSWSLDFDLDDGIWIVIAFLVFVAVLAVAGGWIIYDAPHMFGEAAFQCFLASGLLRGTRALKAGGWPAAAAVGGWQGVVARRTVIPFLLVAVAAVVLGHVAQRLCPAARSLVEAFRLCG